MRSVILSVDEGSDAKAASFSRSRNLNAQPMNFTPQTDVGSDAAAAHVRPTIVKAGSNAGNHIFFLVLVLALVYYEWRKHKL